MSMSSLSVGLFATFAVGGVAYAFVYPYLSGDIKSEKRHAALSTKKGQRVGDRQSDLANRRKQVADSLKDLDARKNKKASLENRIAQAGLKWTKQKYFIVSAALGFLVGFLAFYLSENFFVAIGGLIVGGIGLPPWLLNFLKNRRLAKFLHEFPTAIDIIIRGVKSGLPLGDCLRVVANEVKEPVKSEFRLIVEAQTLGLGLGEAVERIVERVPLAEASFFSIVINIQQKAGGSLSEALGNLSAVLRDRKKMKGKIKAMSSEAKASAGIIGSLPFIVTGLVYLTSPGYISLLWTTSTGQITLGVCAIWMSMGIFIMKKMISFQF
jgi:tight adherence protein B